MQVNQDCRYMNWTYKLKGAESLAIRNETREKYESTADKRTPRLEDNN